MPSRAAMRRSRKPGSKSWQAWRVDPSPLRGGWPAHAAGWGRRGSAPSAFIELPCRRIASCEQTPRRRATSAPPPQGGGISHDPPRRLPEQASALSAGRATARDHADLLLLAGEPGALPVDAARRSVRSENAIRLVRQFREGAVRPELSQLAESDGHLLLLHRRRGDGRGAAARGHGRQGGQGQRRLPDADDLAICGRAGDCRHAVAVPVQPLDRHARLRVAQSGHRLGSAAERRSGDGARRHGGGVEADQLQLPVLRRRACRQSRKP